MAKNTLVTYGTVVKTTVGKDQDLTIEWELDGGMTAYQSFSMRTKSGQRILMNLCKAADKLSVSSSDDFVGKRCRIFVETHTPCDHSNTFFFVVGFDI